MAGILYGVGVGPGDPELITLKAKKVLEKVHCIAVPKAGEKSTQLALSIISDYLNPAQEILELIFPMTSDKATLYHSWQKAAEQIIQKLDAGMDLCFVTLGDPTLYSTYMYVHKLIAQRGYRTEIIPGITAMSAIAAKVGISLAENDETLAVVPSGTELDLEAIIRHHDNIVLMKVSKNYQTITKILRDSGLEAQTITASRCGLPGEQIQIGLATETEKPDYFTTLIIKKNGV